jgi:ribonuclease HI
MALEYNIDKFNNNNIIIPICPTIYIEDNRLTWIKNIINEPISLQLFNIHMSNNSINQLEFWTDGSLKNPSSLVIKLGYGWIQADKNKKIINSFSGALSQWPSSTHAEIFSLLTAILTCPANSIINIYLDSQATIDGFNNWKQKSKTIRSYLKINNFSVWDSIYSTMEQYNLTVVLTKVKAHSNKYPLNDAADSLAKLGSSNNQITKVNIDNITKKYVTLYWKEFLIDYHYRNFMQSKMFKFLDLFKSFSTIFH